MHDYQNVFILFFFGSTCCQMRTIHFSDLNGCDILLGWLCHCPLMTNRHFWLVNGPYYRFPYHQHWGIKYTRPNCDEFQQSHKHTHNEMNRKRKTNIALHIVYSLMDWLLNNRIHRVFYFGFPSFWIHFDILERTSFVNSVNWTQH